MIEIHYAEKPFPPIAVDNYGVILQLEDNVAFNLSGRVVLGTIEKIHRWEWVKHRDNRYRLKCEIHIRERVSGNMSKVKNPNGIVKITL